MNKIELQKVKSAPMQISEIADHIAEILNDGFRTPVIIAICGGTCTCKSSFVSRNLVEEIGPDICQAIELDNFQKGRGSKSGYNGMYGHDHPDYFEVENCFKILADLKDDKPVQIPFYNYLEGRQTDSFIVKPKPVIIAEGLFAAHGNLLSLADYIVYVESPLYARLLRRLVRNCYERYSVQPIVAFRNFFPTLNSHNDLIKPQKITADAILEVPFLFSESIEKYNLHPISEFKIYQDFIWEFQISENTVLSIYDDENDLFFCVLHENKIYLSFRISKELFKQLMAIDLNSL